MEYKNNNFYVRIEGNDVTMGYTESGEPSKGITLPFSVWMEGKVPPPDWVRKAVTRESGLYWVRRGAKWAVADFVRETVDDSWWSLHGQCDAVGDDYFDEIGERVSR
jgi:hypothetical protein